MMDFFELKKNPSKHFDEPKDVLSDERLSDAQKLEILRQWEVDAQLLSVAEAENMPGGRQPNVGAVHEAITALEGKDST